MAKVACNFVCAGDGMLLPLVQQTERQRATQMLAPTLSSEPKKNDLVLLLASTTERNCGPTLWSVRLRWMFLQLAAFHCFIFNRPNQSGVSNIWLVCAIAALLTRANCSF